MRFTAPLFLAAVLGCATAADYSEIPPPPTEAVRQRIRSVAVACSVPESALHLRAPLTKIQAASLGAGKGALSGALIMLTTGTWSWDAETYLIVAGTLTVIFIPVLAIAETKEALPKDDIVPMKKAVLEHLDGEANRRAIGQSLREGLIAVGRSKTELEFLSSPAAADSGAFVLDVEVLAYGLRGELKVKPRVKAFIQARVRLLDRPGGDVIYSAVFERHTAARDFGWWAEDGQRIRSGLVRCGAWITGRVIEELFLVRASVSPK